MSAKRHQQATPFWVLVLFLLGLGLLFGTCAKTTVSCWHRGGSVVKNIFDWPVCVEARSSR